MLGITPKSLLHELFADHDDVIACNDVDLSGPCIHKQVFNCEQSDLVVPSVYLATVQPGATLTEGTVSKVISHYSSRTLNTNVSGIAGRGPPAHV